MRKLFLSTLTAVILLSGSVSAQLIGTKNIPGDYATLDLAITDLNAQGVGAGGVVLNVIAGNPQTAPAGGYVITATGTAANTISIVGNANIITASPAQVSGNLNDAIFKIIGSDYVTIGQCVMMENAANTTSTTASNNMTEFGVALFYASATDGAQNNTIIGNTISLNRNYTNTFGIYSNVRHTATTVTTTADITAASGANSFNKVYANNISNVNFAIVFNGSSVNGQMDQGNDIGGATALTGNTITNFGTGAAATSYVNLTGSNYAIFVNHQINNNISYNTITSAVHAATNTLGGILQNFSITSPSAATVATLNNNTVTLSKSATSGAVIGVNYQGISTAVAGSSLSMSNNQVINSVISGAASSSAFTAVTNLAAVATLTMNSNITYGTTSTATTGGFTGVSSSGAVSGTINMQNNQIGNASGNAVTYSVATTGQIAGIFNSGATATTTLNITGNSMSGFSLVGLSTGNFFGIVNSGSVGTAINITGNNLGTASAGLLSFSAAASSGINPINNQGGAATTAITITGNDIRGISHAVAASSAHTFISNSTAVLSLNISNNTFTNLSINSTGTTTFFSHSYTMPTNGSTTISNNSIVTAFNRAGTSGSVVISTTNGSSQNTTTATYTNNNLSNITVAGSTTIMGFNNTDGNSSGTSTKTITGNVFNNWTAATGSITGMNVSYWNGVSSLSTNTLTNFTGQSTITGVSINNSLATATSVTVSGNIINNFSSTGTGAAVTGLTCSNASPSVILTSNTINTLSSSGASAVAALNVTGGANTTVSRNKIYDVSSSNAGGSVSGIGVTSGTTVTLYDNLIGDLRASVANGANPVIGINVTGGTTVNVYYNTVHLNATSSGTNFGTSGISATTSATLNLRNNLVVNLSTAAGTGLTVAYRRSSTTLTSYANTSNNNSFYAGTPSATNLIFTDGTNNDQTFAAFQARVAPRDASSLSENPTFMSLSGASANFLHIAAATSTLLESGGAVIPSFTVDYDNDARPGPVGSVNGGAIAPDIGADEFDGVLLVCTGTPTAGTSSSSPATVCGSGAFTLSSTGASSGPGITYQWQSSTVSGGPYTNVPSATTLTFTTGAISTTTYYVLQVTCTNSGQSVTSAQVTATVLPNPVVTVSPTTGTICSIGGSPVVLTASGGVSYTWSPTTGLTPTSGSPVTANPGATTTYTVTGTDANGCTATASATVNVVETPSIAAPTATPSSVCSGGSSQLLAAGALTTSYTLSTITPNIITPVSPTTVSGWLADADDGSAGPYVMPFSFNFFGATYNQLFVGTNGYISFSNLSAVSAANLRTAQTLPNTTAPNNMVALCMGDLNQATPGVVRVFTAGNAPFRVYVIDFTTVPFYGTPNTGSVSGQIQLFESTNIIEVHVSGVAHGSSTSNVTLGIENAGGTVGSSPTGRSNSVWNVSTPEAYRWAPSGAGTFTYAWTPATFLNNTTIANPLASGITATTTYSVTASANGCSSASASVTITAGSALTSTSSVSPASTVCAGSTVTLNSTPAGGGAPYTYAWAGPNSFTSTAQNPVISNITPAATGVYTITVTDACSAVSTTSVTLTVNPLPAISVTPTSATYCNPGSPVALTATGAGPFTWGPAAGLSATTGANVTASPSAATTYTVSMTDGNGCTGTATSTINVSETPTVSSVTATPASVCNGGNSQLLATASTMSFYAQSSATFAPINSGTGTTVLCNATVATTPLTAGTLDDGYWNGITLPFTFNYFGTNFNSINVQTNGAVSMVPFTTTTGYNVTMPNTAAPNDLIAACFGDLDWRFGNGVISCYTSGVAPNRVFVINYNGNTGGGFYNGGVAPTVFVNTQIQLFETTNIIQIHSAGINGVTTVNHAQGLENAGGTIGVVVPGRNNGATWTATNDAVQFAPASIGYSWSPGTFLNNTAIANPLASGITASTTYTVTTSFGGCTSSGTVTVTSGSLLTSTNSATPGNTVCSGTDVTLGVTPTGGGLPYTYAWSGPNSFTSTLQNPVITGATTAASGTYTIVVTDACGATSTTSVTLTVNPLPTVAVTPTTALYCNPGAPITLSATGATTYSWGPAAGLSATTGASVDASPTVTTVYTVSGTDGNGCVGTATTTITSSPAVNNAVATSTPGAICVGSSTTLGVTADPVPTTILTETFNAGAPAWTRVNGSTGGTPANAAWTDRPDGFVYASGTPYHSNDNTQFVQTNSDAQGSGSTTRTAIQSPAFSTVGMSSIAVDFYHYYRDINDAGDSAIIETSLDAITWTMVTNYSASVGSENAFAHATVSLPPAVDNQPTVYVRFRYKGTWDWYWSIDNVSVIGLGQNFTYSWTSSPVGFTSTAQNPIASPTANTTYSVVISHAGGCSSSATTSVTVNPLPIVTVSGTTTFCAGDSTLLTGTGGGTSQWYHNGTPIVGATSNTYYATTAGVYNMTKTNTNGCSDSAATGITVVVNPLPTVVANATATTICNGAPVTLTGSGATTYTWAAAISVTDNVAFNPSATDTYTVTGTDGNGCQDTDMITVTVNPLPTVVANATATAVCDGSPVTLSGSGASTYTWAAATAVTDNVAFTPLTTDTYTVTGTDGNGCQNTDAITVTVNPLPTVVANATATTICNGDAVTLTGSGASTYTWAAATAVTDNVAFNPSATDTYTVTGTDGNGCTGTDMITVNVNALPVVTVSLMMDTVCLNGGLFTLSGETPTGGTWSGPGVSGSSFDPMVAGLGWHQVVYSYTDANSCTGTSSDSLNVDVCGGVIPVTFVNDVTIYPNPNEGQFTIQLSAVPTSSVQVEVTNELGQLISAFSMTGTTKEVNISTLESGVYFVRVINEGNVSVHRVVKQ